MPETRPRQSSIGSRRRPPKAHIPYRGDSLEVTRKTGVKVAHDPDSDGFETYEHFAQQADKITPYKIKDSKKKKKGISPDPEPQEEEGDSDMEIDSPIHYIANSRQPSSPISRRTNSMSRPVARNSANQFDDVPSPHTRSHNKLRHSNISAGRSRLSQRVMVNDDDPISTTTHGTNGFADMSLDIGFPDDLSISHRSFTELDRDAMEDDEMDGVVDELPIPSPKRKKGNPPSSDDPPAQSPKRKRGQAIERTTSPEEPPPRTQTPDAEDEIQQQLEDLTNGNESIGEQEEVQEDEEEEAVASKKSRMDKGKEKQKEKGQARKKETHREGVRRSQRRPIRPLEWWRNEKYVYERPTHGTILVPHIKEIIRIPEEPKEPLGKHHKRKRGRSKTVQPADDPEEGWDDDTNAVVSVIDWKTKEPKDKRIICLAKDIKPHRAANSEWAYQRIFGDDNFTASGHLTIPVHGRKPTKTTKDNTYTFYLIQGAINLKIHETSSILCTGAQFMVPRGNTYFIENIGDREAKLFFAQARQEPTAENPESPRKPNTLPRTSSVAGLSKTPPATKRATTTGV
ncbi:Mif2/CENP-C like-domain-containing protein [Lentinula edodes]|uniref:Mif2/CENP-C like-domain-containing protein n=1 Tax=Lentinula edodes TaxID=5353 RepID=UPI001E8D5B3C|nr:Mif2/CENP-C like-domain-containing protein [Lentinula edodes]KAH7877971.1 Mif2/CENP-C like-domain-containing protein [Lentinula edodes]